MGCSTCGLREFDEAGATKWLVCLNRALGFEVDIPAWGTKQHARLWEKAMAVSDRIQVEYPDLFPPVDPGYGVDVQRTARLAGVIMLVDLDLGDDFFQRINVPKESAVGQMASKVGPYYEATMSALATIYAAEGQPTTVKTHGLVSLGLLLAGGLGVAFGLGD